MQQGNSEPLVARVRNPARVRVQRDPFMEPPPEGRNDGNTCKKRLTLACRDRNQKLCFWICLSVNATNLFGPGPAAALWKRGASWLRANPRRKPPGYRCKIIGNEFLLAILREPLARTSCFGHMHKMVRV